MLLLLLLLLVVLGNHHRASRSRGQQVTQRAASSSPCRPRHPHQRINRTSIGRCKRRIPTVHRRQTTQCSSRDSTSFSLHRFDIYTVSKKTIPTFYIAPGRDPKYCGQRFCPLAYLKNHMSKLRTEILCACMFW